MPEADRFTVADLPPLHLDADYWSLRWIDETCESYAMRKNVALPFCASTDRGVMATVHVGGGYGYAATGDTTPADMIAGIEHGVLMEDELLVVDRRLAQQVPVRLRAGAADRERKAGRGRQESQLPRHQRDVLEEPRPHAR